MALNDRAPRRGVRISANFWIGIEGIDQRPVLRRGNLSGTGIYFEGSHLIGPRGTMDYLVPTGSMQFLHVESEDRKVVIQVLARIIRVSDIDDMVRGKRVGLAVEFMPATQVGRQNLARLVRHVVELGLQQDQSSAVLSDVGFAVVPAVRETESPLAGSDRSSLQELDVRKLTIETDWRAKVGETIDVIIRRPNPIAGQVPRSSALAGQVTSVNEIADCFRVEVRVTGRAEATTDTTAIPTSFSEMISESYDDFELPSKDHLSGLLSRIQLPTLLSLIEMEQMTGALHVHSKENQSGEEIILVVRKGRLIDASSSMRATLSLRQLVGLLMTWTEGYFKFEVAALADDERAETNLTELILDLTRVADEANRS